MEKDEIVILEDRGLISISGEDAENFLQNIITNNVKHVSKSQSIFSALLTPQGKYLSEFFVVKKNDEYLIDSCEISTKDIIKNLNKFKLRSKVKIEDLSSKYVVGVISLEKFKYLQLETKSSFNTISYRDCPTFVDPRKSELGARILSNLDKLYLTIKKLNLKITTKDKYIKIAHKLGVPIEGLHEMKEKLFGLEANFEELNAIDFGKGCYVGQENTARMRLKNKLNKRLIPLETSASVSIGTKIKYQDLIVGEILIDKPLPFALVKLNLLKDKEIYNINYVVDGKNAKFINNK